MVIGLGCRIDHNVPIIGAVKIDRIDGAIEATILLDRVRLSKHHDQAQRLLNLSADLDALFKDARAHLPALA